MRHSSRWLSPFFLLLFFITLVLRPANAQGRIDCNTIKSRILSEAVHYCVMLPSGYDAAISGHSPRRYPVLYYLHGLGDNEQTLFKSRGWDLIEDLRQQGKISDFLIVTPDGMRTFYINSADGRIRYSDFFIREFIPYIEALYSIRRERSGRGISGVSMGGYGALRFAFAYPELFSSVSAESAALIEKLPEQTERMHSPGPLSGLLGSVYGAPVDVRHWNQNNPFFLAKQNQAQIRTSHLPIYFNCGREDEFGFDVAAEELHRQLQSAGIAHEFHIYPGNHGAEYFLAHLGEAMVFHSRAFAPRK